MSTSRIEWGRNVTAVVQAHVVPSFCLNVFVRLIHFVCMCVIIISMYVDAYLERELTIIKKKDVRYKIRGFVDPTTTMTQRNCASGILIFHNAQLFFMHVFIYFI